MAFNIVPPVGAGRAAEAWLLAVAATPGCYG